jgi:hypothetical protein
MEFSKHGNGTTSVKVHHAPGGQSNFSLAWDDGNKQPVNQKVESKKEIVQPVQTQQQPVYKAQNQSNQQSVQQPAGKTSVKVHNPPGGKSNFTLG